MYRYLLRASRQRHKDSAKIVRGHEIKNDRARVQSSQAFSDFSDFRLFPRTYNSGTRDAQIQIINALRMGQRNRAQQMLVDFSCMNDSSKAEDFDYILDYCARTPDPLFVMEAWKVMVNNEIDMKKKSYRCIIQAFSKGGYFKEAFEWITSLEESDQFHAGLPLYNMVLRECIYRRSMIDVGRCLELMDNQLVGRSEITYWELLKHSVLQKSLSAVHGLWKDCIKHYTPSIIILRKFIWSFTRLHDLESAYQVLQNMVSLVKSSCSTFRKSAAGRYQSSRLDIPVPPACKLSDEGFRLDENLLFQTMFTKSVIEENCFMASDISGIAGCSSNSIADDLLTEGGTADTCFVSDTVDAVSSGIHEIKFFGEAEEKGTCSKMSSSVAAGIDNQYLLFKKEEMIKHTTNFLQKNNFDYSIPKEAEFIPVVNVLRWSFNDVIQCCAQSETWELADFLFLQMQALGVEPSPHTYDGLIKAITYGRALADGFELIYSMERRGMKPYNDTIASLSVEHSKILELSKAESLLEMISDNLRKYIHPFNAFLVACDIMDEPERAIRMLVKMKCLNIKPNIRTFELLFSLFGNVNAPYERGNWPSHMHAAERIRHIEMSMRRSGVQHSYTSMKNLIRALGMEGMIPEMLQRLENTEKMLLLEMEPHQITDLYNIVLRALVEAGHGLTAIEYFQRMRSYGFLTDAATYHIMLECCSLIACFRSALALTSLMLRDGFFPQIMTYTALVKVLLAVDDFHGALDIFNRASSDDVQLDVHLFNEILQQAYTRISSEVVEEEYAKGLIEVIEIIIEQMRRDKVKPDPSTCTYAFCAYTELEFHSTAMEALRVLSLRMISENEADLHEKKTSFADLICSEEPDVESKIVSIFKGGEEYLATGLLNLRWCTFMAGHPLSWSQEESLWAQRLSSSYFTSKRESVNFSPSFLLSTQRQFWAI